MLPFWYNGSLIHKNTLELDISDPGLLYGATVFTTLRIYHQSLDSHLTNWTEHSDRLRSSIETLSWQPPDWQRLRYGAEALSLHFPVLRITVFPDGREWIGGRFLPNDLTERQQSGICAWLAEGSLFCRAIPEHKTGNYLGAWLALQKAQQKGAKEAILADNVGNWLETTTGNLWGWRDGRWWTPPLQAGILPGVVRQQLIDWLLRHNERVELEPWSADLVGGLEAIAYSNSVVEIVPIHTAISSGNTLTYNPFHSRLEQLRSFFQT